MRSPKSGAVVLVVSLCCLGLTGCTDAVRDGLTGGITDGIENTVSDVVESVLEDIIDPE